MKTLPIGQVIMDPPRNGLPRQAAVEAVDQPRDDHCGHGTHATIRAALTPDVARAIVFEAQFWKCALPKAFTAGARRLA